MRRVPSKFAAHKPRLPGELHPMALSLPNPPPASHHDYDAGMRAGLGPSQSWRALGAVTEWPNGKCSLPGTRVEWLAHICVS
jgi:hypothetical protein